MKKIKATFQARFFAIRTPLLPLRGTGGNLLLPQTPEQLTPDSIMAEALYLASPGFFRRLVHSGLNSLESPTDNFSHALWRYYSRAMTRPTPFGLFAGISTGVVGSDTRVRLAKRGEYRRKTRFDMAFLSALAADVPGHHEARNHVKLFPNPTLARRGSRFHLVQRIVRGGEQEFRLVAIAASPYVERVVAAAKAGAEFSQLVTSLTASDPTIAPEDAVSFVEQLLAAQVLVHDLEPPLTGEPTLEGFVAELAAVHPSRNRLTLALQTMKRWDQLGLGIDVEEYERLTDTLDARASMEKRNELFQVDLFKPVEAATISARVVEELLGGVEVLLQLPTPQTPDHLHEFADRFARRFGDAEVPLLEALDEELGVTWPKKLALSSEPLLDGIGLIPGGPSGAEAFDPWWNLLLRELEAVWREGKTELVIKQAWLDPSLLTRRRLPDAFSVTCALAAPSAEAIDQGDFAVVFHGASGPSGARTLGRFAYLDTSLENAIREHLKAEEASRPDCIFAEVVHLPEGRLGNVLLRPLLREYEISYLGRSGAPLKRQITLDDLLVSFREGRFVLRSRRLGVEVIPRLTTAHNYAMARSLPVYTFLCSLQHQNSLPGLFWDWGPLRAARFLPRVRWGKVVFSRARWLLHRDEVRALSREYLEKGTEAIAAWQRAWGLPRFVVLSEGDNELTVDLSNHLAVGCLLEYAGKREFVILTEMLPGPDQLWVCGPEGRFTHEIVIPFVRKNTPNPLVAGAPSQRKTGAAYHRQVPLRALPPGSHCLFAKLYCSQSTADYLLLEVIEPLARREMEAGHVVSWFYIRYGDPDWHLRVRFFGHRKRLHNVVLPDLEAAISAEMSSGRCWRFELATYEREVERYGGPKAILAAEHLFFRDSQACCSLLRHCLGDEYAHRRWKAALLGMSFLLEDLGLATHLKIQLLQRRRDSLQAELGLGSQTKQRLAAYFRQARKELEALFSPEPLANPLDGIRQVFAQRSQDSRKACLRLQKLEADGQLSRPLTDVAESLIHMHVNRILRADHRIQEMILCHFLLEVLRSAAARPARSLENMP